MDLPAHLDAPPRRYRVLHTITTFSASSGAPENTRLTLKLLPRDRFEVFLATRAGQSMERNLPADVTLLPVRHLDRAIRPHSDLLALVELYQLCKYWRFDVVHTHNSKDGILARWAAHLSGVPVVVHTIHNIPFRSSGHALRKRLYLTLERVTASVTDAFLAVSTENVRDYLEHGIGEQEQFRVVYSGLEFERYRVQLSQIDARARLGLPEANAVVGWFGRLNYQKDPLTFIRAAREVSEKSPGVHFVVCGDEGVGDGLAAATRGLVSDLGLADRVHFLGFRSDFPVVLRAVDVVMHSSRYEGMGRSVCEALLCERPVAGTAVDGMRELIVSGVRGGILVSPGQPSALAEATLSLLRDRELGRKLASAGAAWVLAKLSATDMARQVADIYLGVLSDGRRSASLLRNS
ncbi:MAG TPA: glycosyltransferase [Anaeromyxobacteraceae bacterium]|nr:glycosyltransferase [Anaeromyxobacteraceae bacterium]